MLYNYPNLESNSGTLLKYIQTLLFQLCPFIAKFCCCFRGQSVAFIVFAPVSCSLGQFLDLSCLSGREMFDVWRTVILRLPPQMGSVRFLTIKVTGFGQEDNRSTTSSLLPVGGRATCPIMVDSRLDTCFRSASPTFWTSWATSGSRTPGWQPLV